MKKNIKAAAAFAALTLFAGCGVQAAAVPPDTTLTENSGGATQTSAVTEKSTDASSETSVSSLTEKTTSLAATTTVTSAAETTSAALQATTTASSTAAEATTQAASESAEEKYQSISELPLGEAFRLAFDTWRISISNITDIENNYLYTEAMEYEARNSSHKLSKECTDEFIKAVENPPYTKFNYFWYDDKRYTVTDITDERIVTGEELMGCSSYDDFYVKYAFVRKSADGYEFIIDPACMSGIPLWTADPQFMKFNVNGTEFYGDTIKIKSSFSSTKSDITTDKFVYAKVIFAYTDIEFSTEKGYNCQADLYDVQTITEDTDAVIDRSFFAEYFSGNDKYNALMGARAEIEALDIPTAYNHTSFTSVDLDFDGTDELLIKHATDDDDSSVKLCSTNDGVLTELDDFPLYVLTKGEYNGKRGWVADYSLRDSGVNESGYYFLTLENGEVNKEVICRSVYNGSTTEYYCFGEKIEAKKTDFVNPYNGAEMDIYEWKGYSAYGTIGYLYEKISEEVTKEIYIKDAETVNPYYTSPYSLEFLTFDDVVTNLLINDDIDSVKEYDIAMADYAYAEIPAEKPVLYLYPEEETEVSVQVEFPYGGFTCTYPEYKDGWKVTAAPDGTLYDEEGNEYYCLYWEAELGKELSMDEGFCVEGGSTADFLRESLMAMGLTAREANEFIIYWLPRMEDNAYNVITFHTDQYAELSPLMISPVPDSTIRIFMTWYGVEEAVEITPQRLPKYERTGFTAVEWGGGEVTPEGF